MVKRAWLADAGPLLAKTLRKDYGRRIAAKAAQ